MRASRRSSRPASRSRAFEIADQRGGIERVVEVHHVGVVEGRGAGEDQREQLVVDLQRQGDVFGQLPHGELVRIGLLPAGEPQRQQSGLVRRVRLDPQLAQWEQPAAGADAQAVAAHHALIVHLAGPDLRHHAHESGRSEGAVEVRDQVLERVVRGVRIRVGTGGLGRGHHDVEALPVEHQSEAQVAGELPVEGQARIDLAAQQRHLVPGRPHHRQHRELAVLLELADVVEPPHELIGEHRGEAGAEVEQVAQIEIRERNGCVEHARVAEAVQGVADAPQEAQDLLRRDGLEREQLIEIECLRDRGPGGQVVVGDQDPRVAVGGEIHARHAGLQGQLDLEAAVGRERQQVRGRHARDLVEREPRAGTRHQLGAGSELEQHARVGGIHRTLDRTELEAQGRDRGDVHQRRDGEAIELEERVGGVQSAVREEVGEVEPQGERRVDRHPECELVLEGLVVERESVDRVQQRIQEERQPDHLAAIERDVEHQLLGGQIEAPRHPEGTHEQVVAPVAVEGPQADGAEMLVEGADQVAHAGRRIERGARRPEDSLGGLGEVQEIPEARGLGRPCQLRREEVREPWLQAVGAQSEDPRVEYVDPRDLVPELGPGA